MKRPRPNKESRAVYVEFHDTDDASRSYAKAKLDSGTAPLTPESVAYMRGAIAERKKAKARAEALAAEDKKAETDAPA